VPEKIRLRDSPEIRINAFVILSAILRRSNPVSSMVAVKGAWTITQARREEGTADS